MNITIHPSKSPYTREQVLCYLTKIKYSPLPVNVDNITETVPPSLENLNKIIRLHLIAFPFDILGLHFRNDHLVPVSSQGVYDVLVGQSHGWGSYCFGHNTLLKGMLQGLSYLVYSGCGRSNMHRPTLTLTPLTHMMLFVSISPPETPANPQIYLVDVGFGGAFGGSGLVQAVPFFDGSVVNGSAWPEKHRLIRAHHPKSSVSFPDATGKNPGGDWAVELCIEDDGTVENPRWVRLYHFWTNEFFEEDCELASFAICRMPGLNPFIDKVICIKCFEVNEEGSNGGRKEKKLGRFVLAGNKVEKRIGRQHETVATFETDGARMEALKRFCGVEINAEALEAFKDSPASLDRNKQQV